MSNIFIGTLNTQSASIYKVNTSTALCSGVCNSGRYRSSTQRGIQSGCTYCAEFNSMVRHGFHNTAVKKMAHDKKTSIQQCLSEMKTVLKRPHLDCLGQHNI